MLPVPAPVTTHLPLGHPCVQCGQIAVLHDLCHVCRPANLCDYCDQVAVPGDVDHACADCRREIDEQTAAEALARERENRNPMDDWSDTPGRWWYEQAADDAGVPLWGPL